MSAAKNPKVSMIFMTQLNGRRTGQTVGEVGRLTESGETSVRSAPVNKEMAKKAYSPFLNEAKLERLLFISHKPSCRAMADHVLCFTHGKNPSWG